MPLVCHRGGDLVGALNRLTKNIKLSFQKFEGEMHLRKRAKGRSKAGRQAVH
jgi:hypothetical protein